MTGQVRELRQYAADAAEATAIAWNVKTDREDADTARWEAKHLRPGHLCEECALPVIPEGRHCPYCLGTGDMAIMGTDPNGVPCTDLIECPECEGLGVL